MSLKSRQSQEIIEKSNPTINTSPETNKNAGPDISVPIPDEKEEEAATKTKELQPEREATFKDYLVRCTIVDL